MKKLPIILVISLLLISLAPACATAGIKIEPIQGNCYHIEEMEHWVDDGKESLMIWERLKNTSGGGYWADVNAWVVDDNGYGVLTGMFIPEENQPPPPPPPPPPPGSVDPPAPPPPATTI